MRIHGYIAFSAPVDGGSGNFCFFIATFFIQNLLEIVDALSSSHRDRRKELKYVSLLKTRVWSGKAVYNAQKLRRSKEGAQKSTNFERWCGCEWLDYMLVVILSEEVFSEEQFFPEN